MGVLKVRAGQINLFTNHPGKSENGFVDNQDASILAFARVNGSTSYLKITNGDSGNAPKIAADGSDSNQGVRIETKGSGALEIAEAGSSNPGSIKLFDNDSSHSVEIKAAATIASDVILTLPTDDGGANDFLQTNGSGVLSFAPIPASAVTALNNATENELVTVGSTTTELDAESTLTYDGSILKLQGELRVQSDADNYGSLTSSADGSLTIKAVDANSAADYTEEAHIFLDAEGQIFLNSAAGDIIFSKGGEIGGMSESFLRISRDQSSLDAIIEQTVNNKDIIFRGLDDGSGIDMLKLDASAAGDATFSGDVITGNSTLTGAKLINSAAFELDVSQDITIDSNTGNIIFAKNGAAAGKFTVSPNSKNFRLAEDASNHVTTTVAANGATTVATVDSDGTLGHYTLDIDGNIILDADGGLVQLKDNGTQFGELTNNGGNLILKSGTTTAVTFTGANAVFAGNVTVQGTTTRVDSTVVTIEDPIISLGDSAGDISADDNKDRGIEFKYHNGSASKVGFFGFDDSQSLFTFIPDATNNTEVFSGNVGDILCKVLYLHDKGGESLTSDGTDLTVASGDKVIVDATGDIVLDAGGEQIIFKDGSTDVGHVDLSSDNVTIEALVQDKDILFKGDDGGSGITALTLDMSEAGAATFNSTVTIGTGITTGSGSDNHAIRKSDLVHANLKKHGEISATTPNASTFDFDFAATAAHGSHVSVFLNGIRQRVEDADGNDGSNDLTGNVYKSTAGADGSGSNFTLAGTALGTDDHYNGMIIRVLDNAGGGNQAGKYGFITDYNGTSKVATVSGGTLIVANVDGGDNYQIYRYDGLAKKAGGGSSVLRVEFAVPPASDDTIMADYLVD